MLFDRFKTGIEFIFKNKYEVNSKLTYLLI